MTKSNSNNTNRDETNAQSAEELHKYWQGRCLNFLVRREHSLVELRFKLVSRGCPESLADQLIDECLALNYLNLDRFAYSYAKNRADLGYGPIRARYDLQYQHDIPTQSIDSAFKEIDWEDARVTAERKIRQTDPQKRRQALYRRGFSV